LQCSTYFGSSHSRQLNGRYSHGTCSRVYEDCLLQVSEFVLKTIVMYHTLPACILATSSRQYMAVQYTMGIVAARVDMARFARSIPRHDTVPGIEYLALAAASIV